MTPIIEHIDWMNINGQLRMYNFCIKDNALFVSQTMHCSIINIQFAWYCIQDVFTARCGLIYIIQISSVYIPVLYLGKERTRQAPIDRFTKNNSIT